MGLMLPEKVKKKNHLAFQSVIGKTKSLKDLLFFYFNWKLFKNIKRWPVTWAKNTV
jgi:hypothetical protein